MTKIEWTNETWNPITGCTKISAGCQNCYAEKMAKRLAGRYGYPEENPFQAGTIHEDKMDIPLGWKKPRNVFVCSMGDLFHDAVSRQNIERILDICGQASQHTFQILTKRASRLAEGFHFPDNVWVGITAENQTAWDNRTPFIQDVEATVRFVSLEPLLSDIDMGNIGWLDWAVVGAEGGPGARPMNENWVRHIRDQAKFHNVSFFYKQRIDGGKKISMPILDNKRWEEYPQAGRQNKQAAKTGNNMLLKDYGELTDEDVGFKFDKSRDRYQASSYKPDFTISDEDI